MKIATWNVNGIRARQGQLLEWLAAEKPDIVCLQEIKALARSAAVRAARHRAITGATGTARKATPASRCWWRSRWPARCRCARIPASTSSSALPAPRVPSPAGEVMVASVYVPNGGKDFDAKMRFLQALELVCGRRRSRAARLLILCGDLNVGQDRARHPSEGAQAEPDRRAARRAGDDRAHHRHTACRRRPHARSRQRQPVHVVGAVAQPEAAQHRLAHRLRAGLARRSRSRAKSCVVQREIGISDHGPVVVQFDSELPCEHRHALVHDAGRDRRGCHGRERPDVSLASAPTSICWSSRRSSAMPVTRSCAA